MSEAFLLPEPAGLLDSDGMGHQHVPTFGFGHRLYVIQHCGARARTSLSRAGVDVARHDLRGFVVAEVLLIISRIVDLLNRSRRVDFDQFLALTPRARAVVDAVNKHLENRCAAHNRPGGPRSTGVVGGAMQERDARRLEILPRHHLARWHLVTFHLPALPQLLAILLVNPLVENVEHGVGVLSFSNQCRGRADLAHDELSMLTRGRSRSVRLVSSHHAALDVTGCLLWREGAPENLTFPPDLLKIREALEGLLQLRPFPIAVRRGCETVDGEDLRKNRLRQVPELLQQSSLAPCAYGRLPLSEEFLGVLLIEPLVQIALRLDHVRLHYLNPVAKRQHTLQHVVPPRSGIVVQADESLLFRPAQDHHPGRYSMLLC
mmetsp:Transcript_14459/g.32183  ORF Transcript_14459/g.32183 Transcript_14459/m.32183 type:complete len:376 (-) Transcript_14459:556-1683(-)